MPPDAQTALVVDDEYEVRKFVAGLLTTQLGFSKVTEAQSAEIALEFFKSGEKFDIIFSDWEMPRMKGDEFLVEIRKNPMTKKTPFIMMSYKKDKESLVAAIRAGVTNYIVKPLTAGVFMQKVKKTLSDIERKEVENFKSQIKYLVELTLTEDLVVPSELIEVSDSGCVVRTPIYKRGLGCVYDIMPLAIRFEGSQFNVEGEIVGVQEDKVDISIRQFVMVSFKFRDLDKKNQTKIDRLVAAFKAPKPEEAKTEEAAQPESSTKAEE